jgi:glycerol-3-phosphate acyltransferase PlsY
MIIAGVLISYLLGAIPTAYIIGKQWKGIDIREHGSGNVGATNVFRVLGKNPGLIVLGLDIIKGLVAVTLVGDLLGLIAVWERIILAVAAVSGHNWTIFLRFKGGKGIATSLGVIIGFTVKIASFRPVLLLTLLTWIFCFLFTGFVSFASIMAAIFLPIFMVVTKQPIELIFLGVIFCVFVVFRHRSNIHRLFTGQESRIIFPFSKKK